MIQVCGFFTTCSCSRGFETADVRLSMYRAAASVATTARAAYT